MYQINVFGAKEKNECQADAYITTYGYASLLAYDVGEGGIYNNILDVDM